MSAKYRNCAVTVDANTPPKYCCQEFTIRLDGSSCAAVSMANMGDVPVLIYPTGDTDETAVPHSVITDPLTVLTGPGVFTFDIDCEALDGTEAPSEVDAQQQLCVSYFDKGENDQIEILLQQICDKLVTSNDPVLIAEILAKLEALCETLEVLPEICDKLLVATEVLTTVCEKLEADTEIQLQILECLRDIKAGQELLCEKLEAILGDPNAPCPECPPTVTPICDVSWFLTYAQAQFDITGIIIPGVDTSKVTLPVNGNTLPGLQTFKDQVVQCLQDAGITVEEIQGRDGWTLQYSGPCPEPSTMGAGGIVPQCTNCTVPEEGNPLTGKTVTYTNTDDETEISVSVGGAGDIKFDFGNGDASDQDIAACIMECLNAGLSVQADWTVVGGEAGSVTLLADSETNAPPGFYNDSVNSSGASGKIQELTITCL